jgi:hypothetical protein
MAATIKIDDRVTHRDLCGWFDGTVIAVDQEEGRVTIRFDDEQVGDEEITINKAEAAAKRYNATHPTSVPISSKRQQQPKPTKRGTWSRGTQTDTDEMAVAASFEGRERFETKLREILDQDIAKRLQNLKASILASAIDTYEQALWEPKVTRRYHLRMGYFPDRPFVGNASRWPTTSDSSSNSDDDDGSDDAAEEQQPTAAKRRRTQ